MRECADPGGVDRLGRYDEAAKEFEAAATLTGNEREREVLTDKAARARASG